jgi:hypothetical protein
MAETAPKGADKTDIVARTHRMSRELFDRVLAEAAKTGDGVNGEIIHLIMDGFRFREARVTIRLLEDQ